MSLIFPHPHFAMADAVGTCAQGRECYLVAIKASFGWNQRGEVAPLRQAQALAVCDLRDATTTVLECELVPPKPRVDVVLVGEIQCAKPTLGLQASLRVGRRIEKSVNVSGERTWTASLMTGVVPSAAKAFESMPITWARSFGGSSLDGKVCERRNPDGVGYTNNPKELVGRPVPNFRHPSFADAPAGRSETPVGFGPVGRHFLPRLERAGTYDEAWQEERAPLLPTDFQDTFYCCAPDDQQLDGYQPYEEVVLRNMTRDELEVFRLPAWSPELVIAASNNTILVRQRLGVDTVVIEPQPRRFSLVAHHCLFPTRDVFDIGRVFIDPTPGQQRALLRGKRYCGRPLSRLRPGLCDGVGQQ